MKPSPEALRLAQRLAALPEAVMREVVLAEYLADQPPLLAVQVLHEINALGRRGGPPFSVALDALGAALSRGLLPYEDQAQLYRAAKEAELVALAELFFSSPTTSEVDPSQQQATRELTLGHRKALARSNRREVLDRLLQQPEPEVVPILLLNPRLVERDVVLLAARRPTSAEVQRQIFASARWIKRYAVKRALVLNPHTPLELSRRLLGFFKAQDLRLIQGSGSLPAALRQAARRFPL